MISTWQKTKLVIGSVTLVSTGVFLVGWAVPLGDPYNARATVVSGAPVHVQMTRNGQVQTEFDAIDYRLQVAGMSDTVLFEQPGRRNFADGDVLDVSLQRRGLFGGAFVLSARLVSSAATPGAPSAVE